jgi:hypothetical protein
MSTSKKTLLILPKDNMYEVQEVFDEVRPGWKEVGRMMIWGETLVVLVSLPHDQHAQPESEMLASLRQRRILSLYAPELASLDSDLSAESACKENLTSSCQVLFGMNAQCGWFVLLISLDQKDLSNLVAEYLQAILQRDARSMCRVSCGWYDLLEVGWHRFILPADVNTAFWLERFSEEHPEMTFSPAAQAVTTELCNLPGLDWF